MYSLPAAYAALLAQLTKIDSVGAGCRAFTVPLASGEDSLAWLGAQPHRPQLWWQHRSGHEQVALCGAIRCYHTLYQAEQACRALPGNWRIWGSNRFEAANGFFFLPRLMWQQDSRGERLTLFIQSDRNLREDAQIATRFLHELCLPQPLPLIDGQLQQRQCQPEEAEWRQRVDAALTAIAAGELEKVVLARTVDLLWDRPLPPEALLAASRRANPHCYQLMLRFEDESALVCATPERLWLRQQNELLTEALAGTVARDADPTLARQQAQWLLQDAKNRHENGLVMKDICQRLQELVIGLEVMPPEIVRLRNLQHLRRRIHGELRSHSDALLLQRLQPTAAVAGLPRAAARAFLQRHERLNRDWYAGSSGFISRQKSEFCVTLRCALLQGERVRLYGGAGIVAGSDARQEWQETENKMVALAALLPAGSAAKPVLAGKPVTAHPA
ncbi:isochorismate synthase MenF [Mixta theicola]|uniref:isochorismate synthase n=1 Tax=Mixta theicola TaxID=1458355 RepID=A0A2K1QAQ9_9GAMM|nr:isochorismate synthase [Mixta theicola]PNS12118.1 isochorismate synthase MenF [Mixta theicola]GLR10710.1 menaquinone-specific isochorismate synthase [Mixta theicola]